MERLFGEYLFGKPNWIPEGAVTGRMSSKDPPVTQPPTKGDSHMRKPLPTRSAIMKKVWKARKAKLKKTTAKTTTATKNEAASPRQAIGGEWDPNYKELYHGVCIDKNHLSQSLSREQALRNSLDRDLETISKLVEMLRHR